MITRRDEEISGFDVEPRDVSRNTVVGGRMPSEPSGLMKAASSAFARTKSPEPALSHQDTRPATTEPSSRQLISAGAGPSILSLKIEITGSITTTEELHIYGTVDGNVRAAALTICEGGSVKGEVVAETVVVYGTVEGRIYGKKIELRAGADVRGDITHSGLGIDTSANFEGMVKRSQNPLAEVPVATSSKKS